MKRSLIVVFLLSFSLLLRAQEEKYIGLFVYNFTKYFDWPETAKSGDFVIEVMGHKSVYEELVSITAGKKIGNRSIVVKNFTTPDKITQPHILFIGHWQSRNIPLALEKTKGKPVLIVTEMEGMLTKGSQINFIIRDGKIKFELNQSNIEAANLKSDPRLHELAHQVVD